MHVTPYSCPVSASSRGTTQNHVQQFISLNLGPSQDVSCCTREDLSAEHAFGDFCKHAVWFLIRTTFLGGRVGVRPIVCAQDSISVPPSSKYTFCKVTQLYTSPAGRGHRVSRVDSPRADRFEDRGCRTLSPRGSLAWLRHDAWCAH